MGWASAAPSLRWKISVITPQISAIAPELDIPRLISIFRSCFRARLLRIRLGLRPIFA
jgi:hypothetical protein